MILTEADLHAYNAGDLSPEAVRVLEDDPLAVQDAARLRTLSSAIRAEAPIPIVGRAQTIERLRRKERSRVGVPGFVWAVGAVAVIALVAVTIPRTRAPEYVLMPASYTSSRADKATMDTGSANRERQAQPAPTGAAPASEAMADAPRMEATVAPTPGIRPFGEIVVRARDRAEALGRIERALKTVGGEQVNDAEAKLDEGAQIFRVRVPADRYGAFASAIEAPAVARTQNRDAAAENGTSRPKTLGASRIVVVRWVPKG